MEKSSDGEKEALSECLGINHLIFILLILVRALDLGQARIARQSKKVPATIRIICS